MGTACMQRMTLQFVATFGLSCMPLAAAAHLLDGSPDPLPRWVPIAGLIIAGVMGGTVGFIISRHRQSIEHRKQHRLQRAVQPEEATPKESPANRPAEFGGESGTSVTR